MKLELKKFGTTLSSRPLAKEAWLSTQAYMLSDLGPNESIEVDFTGIDVMTPSWADEYITSLKKSYPDRVVLLPSENKTVQMSLEFVK